MNKEYMKKYMWKIVEHIESILVEENKTRLIIIANNEHWPISMFAIEAIDPMAFVRVFSLLSNMTG